MSISLILIDVGALLFIPAAYNRVFEIFPFGLFVQGTSLALLQTAANPFIIILGSMESSAKRISILKS